MSWNDVWTPCIFCVLLDKTKICNDVQKRCVTCQFFSAQKSAFFANQKRETIMLSFFTTKLVNNFCYFFDSNCTRVKKFPENGHRWCPKSRSTKPFCENRRGARCFAELFGSSICETIHAAVKSNQLELLIFTWKLLFIHRTAYLIK